MKRRKNYPKLEASEYAIRKGSEARSARGLLPEPPCSNCHQMGSHFVGPSFGDPGFYVCEPAG